MRSETEDVSTSDKGRGVVLPDADFGFRVTHEEVTNFLGDWPRLKGKKALYVYVQPRGLLADMSGDSRKWQYAERLFGDHYRHRTKVREPFDGVVVIFMGGHSAVAAASLADIGQWVDGNIREGAFVARCSLDPVGEFQAGKAVAISQVTRVDGQ
jgi:hypothetical protein